MKYYPNSVHKLVNGYINYMHIANVPAKILYSLL